MELAALTCLVAVAEEGSTSGAGRRLGIAASVVARRIRALEQELNRELVVWRRGRGGVTLTRAGHELVIEARTILRAVGRIKGAATEPPQTADSVDRATPGG